MNKRAKTVPITLTYQTIAAWCVCACGLHFHGIGEEGERAMEKAFEEHTDTCAVSRVLGMEDSYHR